MPLNPPSRYPLRTSVPKRPSPQYRWALVVALLVIISGSALYSLPQVVILGERASETMAAKQVATQPAPTAATSFPISVNPATKSIVDNPEADALFEHNASSLTASVGTLGTLIEWIASAIDQTTLYQSLAAVDSHLITVNAGDRKEQILARLALALHWTTKQQQEFLSAADDATPGLTEGIFAPGTYVVDNSMTPTNVAALMSIRFNQTVLSHYSTTTAAILPLSQALTVASLIERETGGPNDMRQISGIIWNRLFAGMNLQIDASLQYAKGDTKGDWWSTVVPKDKYIKSAYNTYAHPGLPPGPIAEPSLAAVVAALNPVQTSCIFYFHDKYGNFHCSDTYAQHVALLKKYYGQGK